MKAKLIKREDGLYFLNDENGKLIYGKLSLKNCQAIERGYDLDELADEYINETFPSNEYLDKKYDLTKENAGIDFLKGFQKALELMGDKKFSEDDVILISEYVRVASQSTPTVRTKDLFNEYQSLQQTEWDVEIEMDEEKEFIFDPAMGISQGHYLDKPKLDADGCLILKRK